MARLVETEQSKSKKRVKGFVITLIILVLVSVGGYFLYTKVFKKKKKKVEIKILDSLDEYGYSISDNDTKLYTDEYKVLKALLKEKDVDMEKYATEVARMFVIDLYTLDTKVNKYDVGGIEYFYKDKRDMYSQKVIDTLYKTMIDNSYGDRKQTLPEVKSIETVSTEETKYLLGKEVVDGYLVKVTWTYKEDLGYDDEGSVIVVRDNGSNKLSVVDFQPTLKPKYDD